MNKNVFFVTNNCMKTREEYLEKFKKLKIQAEVSQIFPSSYLSALYLSRDPNRQSVYCFGSEAMRKEMDKFEIDYFGFENENELNEIDIDRWNQFKVRKNVSHVLCGFDPHFNLTKVCMASSYVNNGAKFIVTNMDHKLPLSNPDITLPDVGAMVASIKVATEKDVDYIAGKPSRMAFEAIQSSCPGKIDSESTVMFGDRLDTDIQFGINCGLTTVLTLTGITSETDAQKSSIKPDYIIPDFTKILMSRIRSELAHLKTFIFDCDGVLWRGNEKLPHVANFMKLLRQENKNVFFVTNNSTKTRSQYVAKFGKHDIQSRDIHQ